MLRLPDFGVVVVVVVVKSTPVLTPPRIELLCT